MKKLNQRSVKWGVALAVLLLVSVCCCVTAFADPSTNIETGLGNLTSLFVIIVRAIGAIFALIGVVNLAGSFASHDPSQRLQGILTFASGLLVIFAPDIINWVAPGTI